MKFFKLDKSAASRKFMFAPAVLGLVQVGSAIF